MRLRQSNGLTLLAIVGLVGSNLTHLAHAGKKGDDPLPRRALLISVNHYLYFNAVHYGSPRSENHAGSSTAVLASALANPPARIPATQIFELSDHGGSAHLTEHSVLKAAIKDFLDTSRPQDRVVILFAGHGIDIDNDSFLVPMNGRRDRPETLIPLTWVFEQMAACKARQKLLILDVFRYSPSRGLELPGGSDTGEMGLVFEKNAQKPPPGVQVWCACGKGQRSMELDGGGEFLRALNEALHDSSTPATPIAGNAALPFNQAFVDKVNRNLKTQISRVVGGAPAKGAAYDPAEPLPAPLALKSPAAGDGPAAPPAAVKGILDEIKLVPVARRTRFDDPILQSIAQLPFSAKALAAYKMDNYKSVAELRKRYKDEPKAFAQQHPVRVAFFDALATLQKSDKLVFTELLPGPIEPKDKAAFLVKQAAPGQMIFELQQALSEMKRVADEEMAKETSRRWRANFEYLQASLMARMVSLFEYSYMLGQIRTDNLPPLEKGMQGWRLVARPKIQVTDGKPKKLAKDLIAAWQSIETNHPDTPWAIMAHRENLVALGLEWRATAN